MAPGEGAEARKREGGPPSPQSLAALGDVSLAVLDQKGTVVDQYFIKLQ